MTGQQPDLTPLQRAILSTYFAIQDHGHFSPESQVAAREAVDLLNAAVADEPDADVTYGAPVNLRDTDSAGDDR